jgi:hypothetical protein
MASPHLIHDQSRRLSNMGAWPASGTRPAFGGEEAKEALRTLAGSSRVQSSSPCLKSAGCVTLALLPSPTLPLPLPLYLLLFVRRPQFRRAHVIIRSPTTSTSHHLLAFAAAPSLLSFLPATDRSLPNCNHGPLLQHQQHQLLQLRRRRHDADLRQDRLRHKQ